MGREIVIGLDVGSTTVKAVVVDPENHEILWHDYRRHHTKQPECVLEFLVEVGQAFADVPRELIRVFITGSGAGPLAEPLGAKFVQEVNAVTLAVEALHPDVGSVVELGGQDAKIIIFKENERTGRPHRCPASMNDKCASGHGRDDRQVHDSRSGMDPKSFRSATLHLRRAPSCTTVAAKCGVFAETDVVNLVKSRASRRARSCAPSPTPS